MRFVRPSWLPEELEAEDYLLLSAVVLLPWAFGGVEMWAYRSASLLLASAAAVAIAKHGAAGLGLGRETRWLLPAFLLAAWAAFQIVPLPPSVLRVLSPRADRLYREAYPGYPEGVADEAAVLERKALELVPEANGVPTPEGPAESVSFATAGRWTGWRTLSLQVDATVEMLFWYVALLLAFLVALRRVSIPEIATTYRTVLFILFGSLAACGLLQALTWNEKLLWVRPFSGYGDPFGPYVNRTNFAGVMELAVPWLAGYAWSVIRRARGKTWGETSAPLVAGTAFLCLVAGVAAGSRMATVLMGLGLSVLAVVAGRRGRWRLRALVTVAAFWAVGIAILMFVPLGDRFRTAFSAAEGGVSGNSRVVAWRASLSILRDFPITGTGFGTFRFVFPGYLLPGEASRWFQAHNDYLEVLLNGGLVAGALLVWLAAVYGARAVRTNSLPDGLAAHPSRIGLLLGLASLSVHAFVDFNHQIPANALLFVTVAALAIAGRRGLAPETSS